MSFSVTRRMTPRITGWRYAVTRETNCSHPILSPIRLDRSRNLRQAALNIVIGWAVPATRVPRQADALGMLLRYDIGLAVESRHDAEYALRLAKVPRGVSDDMISADGRGSRFGTMLGETTPLGRAGHRGEGGRWLATVLMISAVDSGRGRAQRGLQYQIGAGGGVWRMHTAAGRLKRFPGRLFRGGQAAGATIPCVACSTRRSCTRLRSSSRLPTFAPAVRFVPTNRSNRY